ncbi:MAG TPA: ABC transporter ATP-binding protein, partial [Tenacibaculum sp.]|nr:ABC transporter ATP-binding protein [Tenacibaculum sp.]
MLQINDLNIYFNDSKFTLDKISFSLKKNQIIGIVGESGSGKSLCSLAIMGLLNSNAIVSGEIIYKDTNVLTLNETELQKIRGKEIAMIFQDPMSSLNPTLTCGYQVAETLKQHTNLSNKEIYKEVITLFQKVKLPRTKSIYDSYPHEISGGQKQRVMIAMAIACKPKVLIADEPTTALDVTVQKEIINLLKELQSSEKMSIIFISHDLALVSEITDYSIVMYKGKVVEKGNSKNIFKEPKENYTKALINSKPNLSVRYKKLPTVSDFIDNKLDKTIITEKERREKHNVIYEEKPLLEIKNLKKEFIRRPSWFSEESKVVAVDDLTFNIYEGETLGLVGESGCGKTTLGRTILQLEKATSGKIIYKGEDIIKISKSNKKNLKKDIQIIFQDP